jgi:hypothetical protein
VRIILRILLGLVLIVCVVGIVAYAMGARLPVDHVATVSGTVEATPAKVFSLITDITSDSKWRKDVKSVSVLSHDPGYERWIEILGDGTSMEFQAVRTDPPGPDGHATREVKLNGTSYGGTWTYSISPGPTPNETALQITERGFVHPPIYRFMMVYIFGMTSNLKQYLHDIEGAVRSG